MDFSQVNEPNSLRPSTACSLFQDCRLEIHKLPPTNGNMCHGSRAAIAAAQLSGDLQGTPRNSQPPMTARSRKRKCEKVRRADEPGATTLLVCDMGNLGTTRSSSTPPLHTPATPERNLESKIQGEMRIRSYLLCTYQDTGYLA